VCIVALSVYVWWWWWGHAHAGIHAAGHYSWLSQQFTVCLHGKGGGRVSVSIYTSPTPARHFIRRPPVLGMGACMSAYERMPCCSPYNSLAWLHWPLNIGLASRGMHPSNPPLCWP
jgi:hypothetical protein